MWKQKQNKEKTMKIWIARNEQLMEVHSKWKVKHNQSINGKFRRRNRRNGVSSIKAVSRWRWWRTICSRHWKSQCHCQMVGMKYASLCKCTHRTAWNNHRISGTYSHSKRVRDLMQFVHKTKLYCTPFIIEVLNVCVCALVSIFSLRILPHYTEPVFLQAVYAMRRPHQKVCTLHRHIHFVFLRDSHDMNMSACI